jgi:hypothetical protein
MDLRQEIAETAPTEPTGGRPPHPLTCLTSSSLLGSCAHPAVGWRWYAAFGWVPVCASATATGAHLRRYDADLPPQPGAQEGTA